MALVFLISAVLLLCGRQLVVWPLIFQHFLEFGVLVVVEDAEWAQTAKLGVLLILLSCVGGHGLIQNLLVQICSGLGGLGGSRLLEESIGWRLGS